MILLFMLQTHKAYYCYYSLEESIVGRAAGFACYLFINKRNPSVAKRGPPQSKLSILHCHNGMIFLWLWLVDINIFNAI